MHHPPILFLDIDGVLVPFQEEHSSTGFQPRCVAALRLILDAVPSLRVVFSSTWRLPLHVNYLHEQWLEHGLPIDITLDGTPDTRKDPDVPPFARRGHEIRLWLEDHPWCSSWVVVDDDWTTIKPVIAHERCVFTNPRFGLELADAEKAIEILQGGSR